MTILKLGTAALVLVLLAGCDTMGSVPTAAIVPGVPYTLSTAEQAAIKQGVTGVLKDPTSPIFGKMAATKDPSGNISVCGYVNAKNSFGGYVGDTPYLGSLVESAKPVFAASGMGGTDIETQSVNQVCQQYGIVL